MCSLLYDNSRTKKESNVFFSMGEYSLQKSTTVELTEITVSPETCLKARTQFEFFQISTKVWFERRTF